MDDTGTRVVELATDPEDVKRGFFSVYPAGRISNSGRGLFGVFRVVVEWIAWIIYGRDQYFVKVDKAEIRIRRWNNHYPWILYIVVLACTAAVLTPVVYFTLPVVHHDTATIVIADGTVVHNAVLDLYVFPASSPVMSSLTSRQTRVPFNEGDIARGYFTSTWSHGRDVNISVARVVDAMIGPPDADLSGKCMCGTFLGISGLIVRTPYDNQVMFDPRPERRSTEGDIFPWPHVPSVAPYIADAPVGYEVPTSISATYIDATGRKKTALFDADAVVCITYCRRLARLVHESRVIK